MATGNMYFTCGSSVCKQKRMRTHLYTYAYTGSVRVITCRHMWSNAAFDSTLATPRFGIIRTSYEQLWSRKRIHAQDLHVRQHLRALRMCARIRPQPRYGGNVKSASHGVRELHEPRRSAVSTSRPGGDRFLLRDECSAVAATSPASDLARAGDPHY